MRLFIFSFISFFLFFQLSFAQEWGFIPDDNGTSTFQLQKERLQKRYEELNFVNAYASLRDLGVSKDTSIAVVLSYYDIDCAPLCWKVQQIEQSEFSYALAVRNKEKWKQLVQKCESCEYDPQECEKKRKEEEFVPPANEELAELMKLIIKTDQKYRGQISDRGIQVVSDRAADSLMQKQKEADRLNFLLVSSIIKEYGYPGKTLVGSELDHIALFVLHHQPSLKVHEKYLPILEEAEKNDEVGSLIFYKNRIMNMKIAKEKEKGVEKYP